MKNTKNTNQGFKAQIIHNLDAHENHLVSADNCASIVAENMAKAYNQKIVGVPKLDNAEQVNKACINFVEVALELDFKKLSGNKKSCLRKAIVVAVGLVKSGALSEVKGKSLSDTNKLWVDGDFLKSKNNLKHLNKDGATQVALGFGQLTSMAKEVLNMKTSKNSSSFLELACSKLMAQLEKMPRLEENGYIQFTDKEERAINLVFNKLTTTKAEINAQRKPRSPEAKVNFA